MLDRRRELLGALDPVELVEEAPVVDVEISVDQDVSQADGLGEACAEGARDHGVRGERAERLGIGLRSGGAGSREDVQGDVRAGLCQELRVPLRPVLNDFIGEERVAATSTQRAQDAQGSLQRPQPSAVLGIAFAAELNLPADESFRYLMESPKLQNPKPIPSWLKLASPAVFRPTAFWNVSGFERSKVPSGLMLYPKSFPVVPLKLNTIAIKFPVF